MGLFARLVLFSPVSGVVLKDGLPVAGAELRQEVRLFDRQLPAQRVTTDASGRFFFPVVDRRAGLSRCIPHQPVIMQAIIIVHGGVELEAWRHMKGSYEMHSELDGHALDLRCDLAREPGVEGKHYGICMAL